MPKEPSKYSSAQLQMVFCKFLDWYNTQDSTGRKQVSTRIDLFLDDLASDDFFGTEGQLDPRGDPRG